MSSLMNLLERVAKRVTLIYLGLLLMGLGMGVRSYGGQDYWVLGTPSFLEPYISRGIVKRVYMVRPNPSKQRVRHLGVLMFSLGWLSLSLYILMWGLSSVDWDDTPGSGWESGKDKDKAQDGKRSYPKGVREIREFIKAYPITIVVFSGVSPKKVYPLIWLYIKVVREMGFVISYGEVGRSGEKPLGGMPNLLGDPDYFVGKEDVSTSSKVSQICSEVARFRCERDSRKGKGEKQALVVHDADRIITLSKLVQAAPIDDIKWLSGMGLQGYDMRVLLTLSNREDYLDQVIRMGGSEVGVIEFSSASATHVVLKAVGQADRTVALALEESTTKQFS